jgi:argininosuccinate lyase
MSQKTWGGRFDGGVDARTELYTESISFDRRLYRHDILGSQAQAKMLAQVGMITLAEAESICTTLDQIGDDLEAGKIPIRTSLEDIHTHIESALIERLGDTGRKLHTGRSRNDQVVTAMKLWTRDALDRIDAYLLNVQKGFVEAAENHKGMIIPGYTHLQRAQPVLAAHYFLAYVEKFQRDRERLADCRKRLNRLPLGAAALAGSSLPIDRRHVAKTLGFDDLAINSLDVSSDRDFLVEYVFALSMVAIHLGGWAEEWVLWSTTEFGFLNLPDAFCTGSSIMPHKKNPDVLELMRGKTARVISDLNRLQILLKGLPLAYNRDLQEDKPAVFDAHDTVEASLDLAAAIVRQARLKGEQIAARIEDGFLDATTLMEFLVGRGVPLRTAHEIVGKMVRLCEKRGCRLVELGQADFDSAHPGLTPGVYEVLGVSRALMAFRSEGSTAPSEVERQLDLWKKRLEE